jgi:hypothetical protein
VARGLLPRASLAAFDVEVDEGAHAGEVEVARGELEGLLLTEVTSEGVVVTLADEVELELVVVRHVEDVAEVDETIFEGEELKVGSQVVGTGKHRVDEEGEEIGKEWVGRLRSADALEHTRGEGLVWLVVLRLGSAVLLDGGKVGWRGPRF